MATFACLHQKMRQDRLTHINERDIARSKWKIQKRKKDMNKMLKAKWKKRLWNRKMELKAAKLHLLKEGACFTPDELGDCPVKSKHHWSPKSYKARMDCLERVRLMSPDLPLVYQGHNWTRRAMAFCKRCPGYWGHATGSRFKDELNLVVATLGIHYAGHERVKAERTHQDKEKLKIYQKKFDYRDAFTDYVQQMMHWVPKSVTNCPT